MRKLFLLIPALVFALVTNADVIDINTGTSDALRKALNSAADGDIIEMAAGTYVESPENYIAFTGKSVIVRAAEGAEVIVKPHVPFTISEGARAEIRGIKIDASELCSVNSYSHLMYPSDGAADNRLILDGCEIYGYAEGKAIIASRESNKLDSLIINNCKFYNHTTRSCVFLENTENKGLIVTNSTFYNIATGTADFNAGIIDNRNAAAKVRFDHCTFYNVIPMNTDYSCVSKITLSDGIVSNCIFMLPSAQDGVRAMRGVTANNCLTYNYIKDSNTGIHSSVTKNNCFQADPLFTDAANGDFSFPANWVTMNLSPACGAATDGTDLGDPRWAVAETLPSTDFASPYVLLGEKALLSGSFALNGSNYIQSQDQSVDGVAIWKLHAERQCAVQVMLNIAADNTSGHRYELELLDAENNAVVSSAAEAADAWTKGDQSLGSIVFPAAGDYMIRLSNHTSHSSTILQGVTLSYVGGAVQAMPGTTNINEAWFSSNGTRTPGEKIVIPSGYQHEGWVKWNVNFANAANYKAKVNINCDNGHNYTVALYEDEDDLTPITWGEGEQTEDASPLDLGAKEVPAGNYILKVTNAVQYSHAELVSVQFVNAGGGLVNIPGDITLTEAILSSRAYIDENGEIRFTSDAEHGHVTEESVAWRVNVSKAGYYKFTTSVNSNNGHSYLVSVYNADETVLKGSVPQSGDDIWGAPKTFSTDNIYLEEGEYRVKVQNTTNNSNGRIVSISASYEGGAVVNIPTATVPLNDAILNGGATRDGEGLHFKNDQYVEWNIHATTQGLYTFAATCTSSNYSNLTIKVKQGASELFTYTPAYTYTGGKTISSPRWLLDEGDYTLQLINPTEGSGYVSALSATAEADVFVLDENTENDGSIAAAAGNTYTFLLKRSFEADRYYTICIPVGSWNDELKLAFGDDYELWKMTSATQSGDEIDLNFTQINDESFHAGWPYIIKPSVAVQNPIFYNKKEIKNSTYNNTQSFDAADFIGTFYKGKIDAGVNNLYLQNNDLYYSASNDTPIKGTRAWIRIKPAGAAGVRARIVLGGKVATDINLVNGELTNGVVKTIENGQLVIIRDGVRYNVMGIVIEK